MRPFVCQKSICTDYSSSELYITTELQEKYNLKLRAVLSHVALLVLFVLDHRSCTDYNGPPALFYIYEPPCNDIAKEAHSLWVHHTLWIKNCMTANNLQKHAG